jgi:hypothetical protein
LEQRTGLFWRRAQDHRRSFLVRRGRWFGYPRARSATLTGICPPGRLRPQSVIEPSGPAAAGGADAATPSGGGDRPTDRRGSSSRAKSHVRSGSHAAPPASQPRRSDQSRRLQRLPDALSVAILSYAPFHMAQYFRRFRQAEGYAEPLQRTMRLIHGDYFSVRSPPNTGISRELGYKRCLFISHGSCPSFSGSTMNPYARSIRTAPSCFTSRS